MTTVPVRGIWVSKSTHDALREYAWLKRTTMSNVVRAILAEITGMETIDSVLGVEDIPGRTRLSVKASTEDWDKAKEQANNMGVPLQSLVRKRIIMMTKEEGLL